jgi:hypothetical protein
MTTQSGGYLQETPTRPESQEAAELPADLAEVHAQLEGTRAALATLQQQHAALRKCVPQLGTFLMAA